MATMTTTTTTMKTGHRNHRRRIGDSDETKEELWSDETKEELWLQLQLPLHQDVLLASGA